MSEGTIEALKKAREQAAEKAPKTKRAAKPSAEAKEEKEDNSMKTNLKTKAAKKTATPKSGERKEKVINAVKKETFNVPEKFVRHYEDKDHIVEKKKEGWLVDGHGPVASLREAMIAILKSHKKEVGHRAASYFFANVKAA